MSQECPPASQLGCVPLELLVSVKQMQCGQDGYTTFDVLIFGLLPYQPYKVTIHEFGNNDPSAESTLYEGTFPNFPYQVNEFRRLLDNGKKYQIDVWATNPTRGASTLIDGYCNPPPSITPPPPPLCDPGYHLECVSDNPPPPPPTSLEQITSALDRLVSDNVINSHMRDGFVTMFSRLIELAG